MGELILLPNLLDPASSPELYLPAGLGHVLERIDRLIAETAKAGRAYLSRFLPREKWIGIPIVELNEHSTREEVARLAESAEGLVQGLVSDAGLPAIADPGAELVSAVRLRGVKVSALAGPSSVMLALQLSGFPAQSFTFHGYLPRGEEALHQALKTFERQRGTHLWIEAPYRTDKMVEAAVATFSPQTRFAVASALTTDRERVVVGSMTSWRKGVPPFGKEPAVFLCIPFDTQSVKGSDCPIMGDRGMKARERE
jgi:16S rRNA (cytidine1402-2'-O)-methyltransferase